LEILSPETNLMGEQPMNDPSDITHLNRLYLLKARELALQGEEGRATYLLGIPNEALHVLIRMPLSAIEALAESGLLVFGFRAAMPCLRAFAAETADGSNPSVLSKLQYLASHKTDFLGREDHVDHHA
jgi:hypothetical protein